MFFIQIITTDIENNKANEVVIMAWLCKL